RVQDLPDPDLPRHRAVDEVALEHRAYALLREPADADRKARRERGERGGEMTIARGVHLREQRSREFVRCEVASRRLEKRERAVVQHEPVGEESLRRAEAPGGPAPEPPAAHLRARAV